MASTGRRPQQQAHYPTPGVPLIPESFAPPSQTTATQGYVLNHTALQVSSASASLDFYVGFLGMSLMFATNTGLFSAYYLGYPQETDTCPSDMTRTSGLRSGLLELIVAHEQDTRQPQHQGATVDIANVADPETYGGQAIEKKCRTTPRALHPRLGFAHIGIRVPDVQATLQRAEQHGWQVRKRLHDIEPRYMPLPSWPSRDETNSEVRDQILKESWQGGFEYMFAQIGFIEDPDG
ncbi:uncharacterized protein HMPREF1541_08471 [Cyphellophora europaea CBS 101466]|uniref:Glyoxalase/fosfomycin resistance/dioxygenase domain-containing protein n=1 Tax=Cyphellophora europaea (strain CBS 101466) TaxID=1220924 RepID=W2RKD8_CYPE1|nr:uncharacterized protein HMPREF1541_08471 [Cyphellophora europaea CBS 101466]ETN36194.1 hypothetical protein HMPREF1541_08471 [Cyphellophora europaea CBS 101466]